MSMTQNEKNKLASDTALWVLSCICLIMAFAAVSVDEMIDQYFCWFVATTSCVAAVILQFQYYLLSSKRTEPERVYTRALYGNYASGFLLLAIALYGNFVIAISTAISIFLLAQTAYFIKPDDIDS